jgi:hypothetical protein
MDSKQTFCNHLDIVVGLLTVVVLISELMPFASTQRGIAHMIFTSFKKKRDDQEKQQRRNENITIIKCECGSEVKELGKNGAYKKHLSCKKHQEWLDNQPSTSS